MENNQVEPWVIEMPVTFPVVIDYNTLSIDKLVKSEEFAGTNPAITAANFPSGQSGIACVELKITRFRWSPDAKDGFKLLKLLKLRPAILPELLYFNLEYPKILKDSRLIALGSLYERRRGDYFAPFLCVWNGVKILGLHWMADESRYYPWSFLAAPVEPEARAA